MHVAGDIVHNVGSFVKAILSKPSVSLPAKCAMVCTDSIEYQDVLKPWSEVTGRRGTFVGLTDEQSDRILGLSVWRLGVNFV